MIEILIKKVFSTMVSLEGIRLKMKAFDAAIIIFAVAIVLILSKYVDKFFT